MRFSALTLILLLCQKSLAANVIERAYSSFIRGVSVNSCSELNADASCKQRNSQGNLSQLESLSKDIITNRLVELDQERSQCTKSQWDSLKGNSPVAQEMKKARVTQLNSQLAALQDIRNEIESIQRDIARGPSLAILQQKRKHSKNKSEVDKEIQTAKAAEDKKQELAQVLITLYNQKISEIPNSDDPVMAEFIQSRLSYLSTNYKPVTMQDYDKLIGSVTEGLQNSSDDLNKSKNGTTYNLSVEEKERLASDPTLIGQITKEFPNSQHVIEGYQCEARQHAKTKKNVELAATAASFALSGGALVMAQAARASFVANSTARLALIGGRARTIGYASLVTGGAETAIQVGNSCLGQTKTLVQGSCTLNPKIVMEEFQMGSCVWDATLASMPGLLKAGTGIYAKIKGDEAITLANFIDEMRKKHTKTNRINLNYKVAGNLSDEARIRAAEGIAGRTFTPSQRQALIDAHNIDPENTLGNYSKEVRKQKREHLMKNGFTKREAEQFDIMGITGNAPDDVARTAASAGGLASSGPSPLSKFGLKDRDPTDPKDVRQLTQDVSYLIARKNRAPAEFEAASDKILDQVNAALANPAMKSEASYLAKMKEELLREKFTSGKDDFSQVPMDQMKNSIAELQEKMNKAGIKTFDDPPPELAAEHDMLKKLKKAYDASPEGRAESQAKLAKASSEFKAQQSSAETSYRSTKSAAAQPFAQDQAKEIETLTQTLRDNPASLTPEQAKKVEDYRRAVREKNEWRDGQYSGIASQDKKRAEDFAQALDQAASRLNSQSSGMHNLADSQGRSIKLPSVDTNRTNAFGERTRESVASTQGARMARPETEVIMTDLRKATPNYDPRLEQIVQFKPVVGRGDTMKKLEDNLSSLGITKDEIHSANIASTVDVMALDNLPGTLQKANSFAQKIYKLSQEGRLQPLQNQLGNDGTKAVQQLIQVVRQHQKDYIPPHLRIKKFGE